MSCSISSPGPIQGGSNPTTLTRCTARSGRGIWPSTEIAGKLNQHRYKNRDYLLQRLAQVQQGNAAKCLFDIALSETVGHFTLTYALNAERLAQKEAQDGKYLVGTTIKTLTDEEIDAEVRGTNLSWLNALLIRWTFRLMLLKTAYTATDLDRMVAVSRFGRGEIRRDGIGFDLRLAK